VPIQAPRHRAGRAAVHQLGKEMSVQLAASLRHTLTTSSAADAGFLVQRIVSTIADLEGVWSVNKGKQLILPANHPLAKAAFALQGGTPNV